MLKVSIKGYFSETINLESFGDNFISLIHKISTISRGSSLFPYNRTFFTIIQDLFKFINSKTYFFFIKVRVHCSSSSQTKNRFTRTSLTYRSLKRRIFIKESSLSNIHKIPEPIKLNSKLFFIIRAHILHLNSLQVNRGKSLLL